MIARALFRAPDGLLRQAHTSPVYIAVDEKPTAYADDARYMLRWIEVLEGIARAHPERFPNATAKREVVETYNEARLRYRQIIGDALVHLGGSSYDFPGWLVLPLERFGHGSIVVFDEIEDLRV